jgi:RNA polymerase sigma-70 factor, ECF subfamily
VSGDVTRSDDDIMRDAAGANPAAFAEVFSRHHGRIYGYLLKLTGTSDGAGDLAQETFLLAFRSRATYQARGCLEAWLYRIATNLARARFSKRGREPVSLDAFESDARAHEPAVEHVPSTAMEEADMREIVKEALGRLPEEERAVVVLRHFQGMKFREVAESLGITESTAKSRMRYAMDKLANVLRPYRKELM